MTLTVCVMASVSTVASAQPVSGDTALPGARRMVLLDRPASVATVALSGQYGFTGDVLDASDRHHRLAGRVALAFHAGVLSIGGYMSGRRDAHTGDSGSDDSIVGDPGIFALLRLAHVGVFRLGLGMELWAPGGDDPGIVAAALSPSATLHAQLTLSDVRLALRVGYLVDRSLRSIPDGRVYAPGDQVSLGVTAADAVLVGLGVTGRVGALDLYGDLSLDALVRREGVPFAASRATATLGAMVTMAQRYHLGMEASVLLGSYPAVRGDAPYRVEPRVTVGLRFAADLGALRDGSREEETGTDDESEEDDALDDAMEDPGRVLRGRVNDPTGAPLRARVTVLSGGEQVAQVETSADGDYELTHLPPGPLTLVVEADGQPPTRTELGADAQGQIDPITVSPALPDGEIRGSVRGLRGSPVAASITISGSGQRVSADADGLFSIIVTPGSHVLHIEAPGYRSQDRPVTVEETGVVVIEVHLRPQ